MVGGESFARMNAGPSLLSLPSINDRMVCIKCVVCVIDGGGLQRWECCVLQRSDVMMYF